MSIPLSNCQLLDKSKKRAISRSSALIAALIALAIFNPWTFGIVDGLAGSIFGQRNVIATANGRPTTIGLVVHTVVMLIIAYLVFYWSMKPGDRPLVCCDPATVQVQMN